MKSGVGCLALLLSLVLFNHLDGPTGHPKRLAYVVLPCSRAPHQLGGLASLHDRPSEFVIPEFLRVSLMLLDTT